MRKFLCLLLVLLINCVSLNAWAQDTKSVIYNNEVYVYGDAGQDRIGERVTLLLQDSSEEIAHLDYGYVNDKGFYKFDFKTVKDMRDYSVKLRIGDELINDTVIEASYKVTGFEYDVDIKQPYLTQAALNVEINNIFGEENKECTVVCAMYDGNNKMLGVKTVTPFTINAGKNTKEEAVDIIPGTEKIKVFLFNSLKNMIPLYEASQAERKDEIKVLAIGNSFTVDATRYLHDIAASDGVDILAGNLYYPGCTISQHYAWAQKQEEAKYRYYYENGEIVLNNAATEAGVITLDMVLEREDWDYITIHQGVVTAGDLSTYQPHFVNLCKYIKEQEPQAEILVHQTWPYEQSERGETCDYQGFAKYDNDQELMWTKMKSAYETAAKSVIGLKTENGISITDREDGLRMIPAGEAVQLARATTEFSDGLPEEQRLSRDGYHMGWGYGRYLLGMTWYTFFKGDSATDNTYIPENIKDNDGKLTGDVLDSEYIDILQECAYQANLKYNK